MCAVIGKQGYWKDTFFKKPTYDEYITHEELYKAIGETIIPTHITGLQRAIYTDN